MTIFNMAFDTSACSGLRLADTYDALKKASVTGSLHSVKVLYRDEEKNIFVKTVTGIDTASSIVPSFNHPLYLEGKDSSFDKDRMVIDARPFTRVIPVDSSIIVRNQTEMNFLVKRAALNAYWLTEKAEHIRDISPVPAAVYASLISECIARRFALDPGEQAKVQILACYFYFCLFTNENKFDEMEFNRTAGAIARITKMPAEKVFDVLEGIEVIADISQFCQICSQRVGAIALQNLNIATLFAVVTGTWIGANARENIVVALEHPPTWIVVVYLAMKADTYRSATITKIAKRYDKGDVVKTFANALEEFVGIGFKYE